MTAPRPAHEAGPRGRMGPVARVLARGWRRGARRWYLGTSALLALALTVLACVGAALAGMEQETQERVADFYTDGLRVAPEPAGALPPSVFRDLDEAVAALGGEDRVRVQYESQVVLARRGLEAALLESDRFDVDSPGADGRPDAVALGAVLGMDADDPRVHAALRPHLLRGGLQAWNGTGPIPVLMSLDRLERFLSPAERAALSWPPTPEQLAPFRFQVTAAKLENGSLAQGGRVILRTGVVTGVFQSGVDLLDAFTLVAPIEAVRDLNGQPGDAPVANALLVSPGGAAAARRHAEDEGWHAQGAEAFSGRYLGQLMRLVQGITLVATASLFLLPAFLVLHGLTRLLETHNREIAVLAAVGMPGRAVRAAILRLAARLWLEAVLLAAGLTAVAGLVLHAALPRADGLPLPMDFHLTPLLAALAVATSALAVGAAVALAVRSQGRMDLAAALRTF